jgi:hypothetical protein
MKMAGIKSRLVETSRTLGLAASKTPNFTSGRTKLELLPYETRAMIFERLGYSHVCLTLRLAMRSNDEDEVNHRFLSNFKQITFFGRTQGWKSKIVAFEYESEKWFPISTTVQPHG